MIRVNIDNKYYNIIENLAPNSKYQKYPLKQKVIKPEILNWLKQKNMKYWTHLGKDNTYIIFEDKYDAIKFKLVWSYNLNKERL